MTFALLLSTAVNYKPEAYPADWSRDEVNPMPDLALGTNNDWWLRTSETDDSLYIQCRYHKLEEGGLAQSAWKMMEVCQAIEEHYGHEIKMPWTPVAIDIAYGSFIRKENEVKEFSRIACRREFDELILLRRQAAVTKCVKVEVSGGVAEVTECPEGVEVEIIDHDDLKAEGKE